MRYNILNLLYLFICHFIVDKGEKRIIIHTLFKSMQSITCSMLRTYSYCKVFVQPAF